MLMRKRGKSPKKVSPPRGRAVMPGRFGWPGRGGGGGFQLEVAPEWRGTSKQVCGLWPFAAGSAAPLVGVPVGKHLLNGSTVCADPVNWFLANIVNNPSAFILGRPGLGKSSLTRRMVTALAYQGFVPLIMSDLKPDYVDLTLALGGDIIPVGRGVGSINPLDKGVLTGLLPKMSPEARKKALEDIHARQTAVLRSLIEMIRNEPLGARQQSILATAIRLADERFDDPLVGDVENLIRDREPELRALAIDRGEDERYDTTVDPLREGLMALGPSGPFGDIFSERTSHKFRLGVPTCFDVSSVDDADTLLQAAVQAVTWSYGSAMVASATIAADDGVGQKYTYVLIMDELWRILRASAAMIDLIDAITRLNRQKGLAQVMITHTMSDLRMATEALTERAWGFVERSSLVFMGGLAVREMGNLREVFDMSRREVEMIQSWSEEAIVDPISNKATSPPGQGCFLLKTGKAPGIPFRMRMTPTEKAVNDTNKRWRHLAVGAAATGGESVVPSDAAAMVG
ncbi:hypothetical protein GGQ54_003344 [Naumannella cuiyingiana]|uniref:ATP/GTP-binding protein n=1 Tax=Naumannella cuiyingiana TaxID=1347891 RepID=A0A7Z0DBU5_9ACTN|nr:hypothetical protein [Naumannella cuiyingiana]NYI72730.1 hypothetical protein [Naumannella cuiyingiana]